MGPGLGAETPGNRPRSGWMTARKSRLTAGGLDEWKTENSQVQSRAGHPERFVR